MQINAEESVENDNGKTSAHDNIRDGIPKMLDQSWGHGIMKKVLSRIGVSHQRRSTTVAPPAKANRTTQTTAPASTQQQPVVRDTATTATNHSVASHPSAAEASGASDSAPVQVSFIATNAQDAGEPSLAPGTVSPRTEKVAAPNAEGTSTAPLEGDLRIPISSPGVTSYRESTTAMDDTAPVIAPTSNDTMNDIAPVIAQPRVVEEESKNDDHRAAEPAIREDGESKREKHAKEHVTQILENLLAGHERAKIAILVDIEDYRGSRRVCVKCFDGAAEKANEIKAVLSKHGPTLQGFPYVVHRRGKTKIFGYKGSDTDRTDDPKDTDSENSRGYLTQPFSDTPYWTRESTMVEVLCGDERDGNMVGAPIRMATTRWDGYSVSMWTCGGIIRVDGIDYGLTTAHPFVLGTPVRPQKPSQEIPPKESAGATEDLIVGNDPFGGKDDFFSTEHHPEKNWQAIGKVSHYALARMRSIPRNNDWLLFELPKDRSTWNDFGNNAESSIHALAVFSARGPLSAHILEGTASLILGSSPFEVLKIGLREPLRPGDSGSWLMRGNQLVGVMVAGNEEDPKKPLGYAISAQAVYRSISTSMGGLSVRLLTDLENAINANSQTGSRRDLILLRIRQLFDADTPVRRIKVLHDHHTLSSLANIQTGNAALTALLRLGFFCSSLRLEFPTVRRSLVARTPSWSKTERIGEILHQQMSQLSEGLTVTHLILALSASLPRPKIHAGESECARALSVLMKELNISPIPAQTYLQALVVSVRNRYKLPRRLGVHYGGPKEATSPTNLAGSLARALYAMLTNNFYIQEGVTAKYLKKFVVAYTRYPVIAVDEKNVASLVNDSLVTSGVVPRIFVANLDSPHVPQNVKSNDSFYGRVVQSDELNEALESSTTHWKAEERAATRGEEGPGKTPRGMLGSTMSNQDLDKTYSLVV